ncbi:alkaline phosphatase PhoX [Nocardioides sp. YIM 152588]|uniref:alkaline phosphatase PhoX n=1 Tax=Nocardioides sp. YIM 152588 TaxID=3158259 RepID=UPI0032E48BDE
MSLSRRGMMAGSAGVGFAVTGSMPTLAQAKPGHAGARVHGLHPGRPFPPLVDDPAGILALPPGFRYVVMNRAGETTLETGEPCPNNHDGTAAFGRGRASYLILNHECDAGDPLGVPHRPGTVYDPGATGGGGCTVIRTDGHGTNLGQFVALSGTISNCAGGPTPWGTWWTCEEDTARAGDDWEDDDHGASGVYEKDHGYVFEVHGDGEGHPVPLKALGRYDHEACAISKDRRHVFLSEDADEPNGLFFRWTGPRHYKVGPSSWKELAKQHFGTLAAMAILLDDGSVLPDVAYLTSSQLGRPFKVTWVPVPDRDAADTSVREQFADGEVTRGRKFEGVWGTSKGVYVVNSYAFEKGVDLPADAVPHSGMVWFYDDEEETIQLVNYFPYQAYAEEEVPEPAFADLTFDGPDNVTVTPWGSLVLAEDGSGASHVLSSTPGGPTYAIARNMINLGDEAEPEFSEFTGPTFDSAGRVLYVNIQEPGMTLAITGPWEKYLG